jgi:hypothetical protein
VDQGFDRARHGVNDGWSRAILTAQRAEAACYNPPALEYGDWAAAPLTAAPPRARDTMKKGFSTIMSAQFFSSLADNALLVAAVELLRIGRRRPGRHPRWRRCSRCSTCIWRPSSAPLPTRCPRAGDVHLQHHQDRRAAC